MKDQPPCNHEINPNTLVNLPFEKWKRGVCLLCGEDRTAYKNDITSDDVTDKRLDVVAESERRKPIPPNFEFSNPLVNRGKADYTTDWGSTCDLVSPRFDPLKLFNKV